VTNTEQSDTYSTWINSAFFNITLGILSGLTNLWLAGIAAGVNGIVQYQWGQSNLTAEPGTTISPSTTTGESPTPSSPGEAPSPQQTTGESPNDGYSMFVVRPLYSGMYWPCRSSGSTSVQQVLGSESQSIASDWKTLDSMFEWMLYWLCSRNQRTVQSDSETTSPFLDSICADFQYNCFYNRVNLYD